MRSTASPTSRTIVNERTENIGARRLHTVMEKLLDEISFEGPDLDDKIVTIDDAYVDEDARRHREERRPVPVHSVSVTDTTINAEPAELAEIGCALRVSAISALLVVALLCGVRQERPAAAAAGQAAGGARRFHGRAPRRRPSTCSSPSRPPTPTARGRPTSSASTSTRSPAPRDASPTSRSLKLGTKVGERAGEGAARSGRDDRTRRAAGGVEPPEGEGPRPGRRRALEEPLTPRRCRPIVLPRTRRRTTRRRRTAAARAAAAGAAAGVAVADLRRRRHHDARPQRPALAARARAARAAAAEPPADAGDRLRRDRRSRDVAAGRGAASRRRRPATCCRRRRLERRRADRATTSTRRRHRPTRDGHRAADGKR